MELQTTIEVPDDYKEHSDEYEILVIVLPMRKRMVQEFNLNLDLVKDDLIETCTKRLADHLVKGALV